MITKTHSLQVFDRITQAQGAFDRGRITEYKVIGMPQDSTQQKRLGPLFYWSWATGEPDSVIALHPHQGFEIFSYVLNGTLIHRDTLGSHRAVAAGGLQLMQTGSGVAHEEVMGSEGTEFFQIWLEPYLRSAIAAPPVYRDFPAAAFPRRSNPGVETTVVLGAESPVELLVPAAMVDVEVAAGSTLIHDLQPNRGYAALMVRGQGTWQLGDTDSSKQSALGDLVVGQYAPADGTAASAIAAEFTAATPARVVLVEVPLTVDYPLYPNF
jgi:redox-sensitive bicupin YhaK (pirin superfamily)